MGVALVGAGAVIAAALIGIVVSQIQANEKSARLLREAEALSKLPRDSQAYLMMDRYMVHSVARYSAERQVDFAMSRAKTAILLGGALFGVALVLRIISANVEPTTLPTTYGLAIWGVTIMMIVSLALGLLYLVRVVRDERNARKESSKAS